MNTNDSTQLTSGWIGLTRHNNRHALTEVSHAVDRIEVIFDGPNLVSSAGLLLVATLTQRLGLEGGVDATVKVLGRVCGARSGRRKVMTLVHAMGAGATPNDHADMLHAGSTASVLGHRVMAPATLGTFFRSRSVMSPARSGHRKDARAGLEPWRRARVEAVDNRYRLDDFPSRRPCQTGCGVRVHASARYHPLLATRADRRPRSVAGRTKARNGPTP